jgi:serine/threonine protein phosphatase PrpC
MSNFPVAGQPVIDFAEECDQGNLRSENRDSVFHARIDLGELMIVADGSGGHTGGANAARLAVEDFCAHLAALPSDYPAEDALREAAAYANEKLLAVLETPEFPVARMGVAMVVALLQADTHVTQAWIGHIGDCRAYLSRAGRLHSFTIDHSGVQSLLKMGMIEANEVRNHPDTLVLTRSLGVRPAVEIEIEPHPLGIGDTLLLCSDGLWGSVSLKEIEKAADAPTVEEAARNLLELALDAGGHDNIGIEMARLKAPPDPAPVHKKSNELKWVLFFFVLCLAGMLTFVYFFL